jgi:carbonic anhydrase/acetyltransferase-like protein (isoleucine patch superfamily)
MKFELVTDCLGRFLSEKPVISKDVYVAPNTTILGKVTIGTSSSVWFQTVIRADINEIVIGKCSNIQDGSVLHVADRFPLIIGDYVSCGHRAIVHACTIGDRVLIGMGAVVMDGATVGSGSIIGAHTLVTKGSVIPPRSLVLGSPGKIIRSLTTDEEAGIKHLAEKYVAVSGHYRSQAG